MNRAKSVAAERRKRRLITVLWSTLLGIGTISLIYYELTALLYILATLGVSALLIVVAITDLKTGETTTNTVSPPRQS
jgi:hypothetical protein